MFVDPPPEAADMLTDEVPVMDERSWGIPPSEWRPFRTALLDTRFLFNMSLSLRGGCEFEAEDEFEAEAVGSPDDEDSSLRLGTLSCSGNMLARDVPATVQLRPE